MTITYFGNTLSVSRFRGGFHCEYNDRSGTVESHDIFIADPNLLLSEIDDYKHYNGYAEEDSLTEPSYYDELNGLKWYVLDALEYLLLDERSKGWRNLIPDYAKYDCEV